MLKRTGTRAAQRITAAEAAGMVRPGMWLDYAASLAQPDVFDAALALRKADLSGIKIRACLSMRPRAVLEADPDGETFFWINLHFSGYDRRKHDAGLANYLPVNLGEIPDYYRRFIDPVDILVIKTRPMDANGVFNFGPSNLWHRAIIERARIVIVEESRGVPFAHGVDNGVHVSEVDFVIEGDHAPMPALPDQPPSEVDKAVARNVVAEVGDGACLQIGIGVISNAAIGLLGTSGLRDLGVHTEMLSDGVVDLYRAGMITGARKQIDPGKIVYSFALGAAPLYAAIDGNPDFACMPVDYTNLPQMILRNDRVVAINNTTQIDLTGQAASETDGMRHLTGTGGQAQFVRGSYASKDGKSIICLTSTYERRGERRSRIVLNLTGGNVVTSTRADMMYVTTEYGLVNLKGKCVAERARALISIAHPDFREDLEREAHAHRLIPRGFF